MDNFNHVNKLVEYNHPAIMEQRKNPNWNNILAVSLPVLTFLSTAFFVPKKWRDIIAVLIVALQSLPPDPGK